MHHAVREGNSKKGSDDERVVVPSLQYTLALPGGRCIVGLDRNET